MTGKSLPTAVPPLLSAASLCTASGQKKTEHRVLWDRKSVPPKLVPSTKWKMGELMSELSPRSPLSFQLLRPKETAMRPAPEQRSMFRRLEEKEPGLLMAPEALRAGKTLNPA